MMKLRRLCFLVLFISSTYGQDETKQTPTDLPPTSPAALALPTAKPVDGSKINATDPQLAPTSSQDNISQNATDLLPTVTMNTEFQEEILMTTIGDTDNLTTVEGDIATPTPEGAKVDSVTVSMETTSSSSTTVMAENHNGSSWGYVILVLIILVIIVLCVILYFLRRLSRTYSFDLHRQDVGGHQFNEPIGTFEPVYLDDLERPAPKDEVTSDDLSPPPVANGTSLQSEEKVSNGGNGPQEQPDANGLETSPTSNTNPSMDDDPADNTSNAPSSTNLFFDALGEAPQNENNNNPSICSSDPFVEINLDEPAWCDQLLTSPEATSSVLPFTPFSFSSSSSSS